MDYFKYSVAAKHTDDTDIIIAELAELPFDTFEEEGATVLAYMPINLCTAEVETAIADLVAEYKWRVERTLIPYQNWNAVWEASFQPIVIDDFCAVRADFHEPISTVLFDIVINPKMAFGTGHHETTYMMMAAMRQFEWAGKSVFDYGAGTGILAILAAKLGATHIEAIDIEEESHKSTEENAVLNHTPQVHSRCGTLDIIDDAHYNFILANINRNVIIPSLPRLKTLMATGATLLVSGILDRDASLVIAAAEAQGLVFKQQYSKADWVAIEFVN